jgi:hypothetical protein
LWPSLLRYDLALGGGGLLLHLRILRPSRELFCLGVAGVQIRRRYGWNRQGGRGKGGESGVHSPTNLFGLVVLAAKDKDEVNDYHLTDQRPNLEFQRSVVRHESQIVPFKDLNKISTVRGDRLRGGIWHSHLIGMSRPQIDEQTEHR